MTPDSSPNSSLNSNLRSVTSGETNIHSLSKVCTYKKNNSSFNEEVTLFVHPDAFKSVISGIISDITNLRSDQPTFVSPFLPQKCIKHHPPLRYDHMSQVQNFPKIKKPDYFVGKQKKAEEKTSENSKKKKEIAKKLTSEESVQAGRGKN